MVFILSKIQLFLSYVSDHCGKVFQLACRRYPGQTQLATMVNIVIILKKRHLNFVILRLEMFTLHLSKLIYL